MTEFYYYLIVFVILESGSKESKTEKAEGKAGVSRGDQKDGKSKKTGMSSMLKEEKVNILSICLNICVKLLIKTMHAETFNDFVYHPDMVILCFFLTLLLHLSVACNGGNKVLTTRL